MVHGENFLTVAKHLTCGTDTLTVALHLLRRSTVYALLSAISSVQSEAKWKKISHIKIDVFINMLHSSHFI